MTEFKDRKSLAAWLKTRPPEDAVLLASRAALRVLPLLGAALDRNPQRGAAILMPSFRAMAVASIAGKWPRLATEVEAAAEAAYVAAADVAGTYAATNANVAAAYAANIAAADAADVAGSYAADAGNVAAHAGAYAAAHAGASAADAAYAAADAAAAIWAAITSDGGALEGGSSHQAVGGSPLWYRPAAWGRSAPVVPEWAGKSWQSLKEHLLAAREGWEVWTDWYDAILEGRPLYPDLELKKALIPDEVWKQGPAVVNAEIARLIEEHGRKRDGAGGPPDPPRRPPRSGPDPEGHDYDPAIAALAELVVLFRGDLRDERVERELSRFATSVRRSLLEITVAQDVPLVLGNNQQVDVIGLHRVSIAPGSVASKYVVTITCVAAVWGMIATYKPFKEGLALIQSDVEAAVASAIEVFAAESPTDAPLLPVRHKLLYRDESDVLADLLDRERQARLRGLSGDKPAD